MAMTAYGPISLCSDLPGGPDTTIYGGAQTLKDGDVLLFGGRTVVAGVATQVNTARTFHAVPTTLSPGVVRYTYTWTNPTTLSTVLERFGWSYWDDGSSTGRCWVTGGTVDAISKTAATRYYTAGAWHAGTAMNNSRLAHAQSTIGNRIFVTGGYDDTSCEAINANNTGGWVLKTSMAGKRFDHQQVVLKDGRLLVIGGRTNSGGALLYWTNTGNIGTVLNTLEIYDPVGNTWTTTGAMAYTRFGCRAEVLPDGRVLIMGGRGYDPTQGTSSSVLRTCEIWDPATGRCTSGPKMLNARSWFASGLIKSETRVLVGGGQDINGQLIVALEYMDLDKMVWRVSSATCVDREYCTGALRLDDSLFMMGGRNEVFDTVTNNLLYVPSSETWFEGGLNGQFKVTKVDANTFTYETPEHKSYADTTASGMTATAVGAAARTPGLPGPYIFDPTGGVALTRFSSTTAQMLTRGQVYGSVGVVDATQFPDAPGWICFAFGFAGQVGPVRYLGRLSDTALALDHGFRFPQDVPSGSDVALLKGKGPLDPARPGPLGAFYLTGSAAGRVAAQQTLLAAAASGIRARVQVLYPSDRGFGGEGRPSAGQYKLSDKVFVWGGDEVDAEIVAARAAEEEV